MSEQTNPIRILHVDDEPDLAELVAIYLQRENEQLEIESASSARDGLDRLGATEFDCIVSDYDMPGQNGIEFLKAVREDYPDLPFILYTGKGSEEIASEAISAGVTDYLQKGSGTDQYTVLENRIKNAVEQFRSQQALAERNQELRRYKQMINSMHEAACIYDSEGRFELVNEYLAEWYNTTPEALEGEQSALLSRVREHADGDPYQELLAGERHEVRGELEGEFPDHGYAVLEYRLTPLSVDGTIEAVVGVARDITDRRERQVELERKDRAIDAAPIGITISDPAQDDNPLIYVNDHFTEVMGYAEEDVLGINCRFPQGEHTSPEPVARMREAIDNEEPVTVELRNYRKDGTEFWNRVSIAPVRSDENDVTNFVGFQQDITEKKQREVELRRKERRYQAMFNDPNILVGLIDTDGTVLDINETAMDYIDATLDDVRGEPFWKTPWFAHSETAQQEVHEWIKEAASGEYVEFEADLVRPDGEPYTIEGVFRPVMDDDRNVVSLLISDRDITKQKEQKQELRKTKQRLELVLEGTETGIWEWSIDTDDIEWNDTVGQALGLAPGSFEGTYEAFIERVHPDDRRRVEAALTHTIEADEQYHVEFRMIDENGDTVWVECPGVVIERENKSDLMIGLFRDITERKAREIKIQRQNDQLEQFAGIVSHDLRSPLSVAEGRLQLAKAECDSDHLDDVAGALTRMDNLIEKLLTLAQEGGQVSDMAAVDLAELTEQCWQNVETADATLRTSVDRTIRADRSRLAQLLENLMRNAVEHGGENVTVTVGELDDGFYVKDDGPGIPQNERDDVFKAGYSTTEGGNWLRAEHRQTDR